MKKLILLTLSLCIFLYSCAVPATENPTESNTEIPSKNRFVKAIWLSYNDLSELTENADEKEFSERIMSLMKNCAETGFNTLIVHASAFCDAFYDSEILPYSKYLRGVQGVGAGYDVFGIICSLCKEFGISVEAWINPYRVLLNGKPEDLSEKSPVRIRLEENADTDDILFFENGIYLNPASETAQALIISVAREIVSKYPVSAIHIDDYFYPTDEIEFDRVSYEKYISSGGKLSLGDWRRANVASLICSLHIFTEENGISLSLSPTADNEKNRGKLFADIPFFIENGLIDEVIPQIYFGFENEKMPFVPCLEEWISLCENTNTRLIIGLAFYKNGKEDFFAGSGKNEWIENADVISREVSLILEKNTIYGVSFFSYSYIFGKKAEKNVKKELQMLKNMLY